MSTINLPDLEPVLFHTASEIFDQLINMDQSKRPDVRHRTGIQVLVREIGTDNLCFFSVQKPSQKAQFFASEKAVRSDLKEDCASQNSENPDAYQFAGSITVAFGSSLFQCSVSGLKATEDVFVASHVLANALSISQYRVLRIVKVNRGKLPDFESKELLYLTEVKI